MAKPPAKNDVKENPVKTHSIRQPVNKLLPVDMFVKAEDIEVESRKLNEIRELLWLPADLSEAEKNARIILAVELYESLQPKEGAESMLAAQMVGTHYAALECLRRASHSEQTFVGRDSELRHATKLMAIYSKQLETLNKHRGKGQQKVTVEHVYVAAGGQAIVGHVETGGRASKKSQPVMEYREEEQLDEAPLHNLANEPVVRK